MRVVRDQHQVPRPYAAYRRGAADAAPL